MADVEDDAPPLGLQRGGQQPPSCTMLVNWPARLGAPE